MVRISRSRLNMEDGRIDNAILKDYGETVVGGSAGTNTTATYAVNIESGNVFNLILNTNCTFTFSNPPASGTHGSFTLILKQGLGSGSTATWPSSVVWAAGTAPTLSTTANAADVLTFTTTNAGTKWLGFVVAQNYDVAVTQTVWMWGEGANGRLGHNSTLDRSSPAQVGALTNWLSASVGSAHSAVVKTDGTIWAWGRGTYGSLGVNTTTDRSSPTQVGTLATWVSVSARGGHTFGVKTDNTLWAWGLGALGRLGVNTAADHSSPTQVGTLATWSSVMASYDGSAGLMTDGTLWTWGEGVNGRLGHNSEVDRSSPTQVGTLTNWEQISIDRHHMSAIKTDGTLWKWGLGTSGQLGINTAVSHSSPVQVGTLTNWSSVATGTVHTVATQTDGTLWAWGYGANGRVGQNNTSAFSSPTQIGTLTTWTQADAGVYHTAAVKTDGTLWTWGKDTVGQTGINSIADRSSPTQVGTLTTWSSVSVGDFHTAALGTHAGEEPVLTMSFVDSAISNAATITIPATAQAGDLAVLFDQAINTAGTPTEATPTNWTKLSSVAFGIARGSNSYKILAEGEPGSIITGMDGNSSEAKVMFVFRGNVPITTVTPESPWHAQGSSADPGGSTVLASGNAVPLVVVGACMSDAGNAEFSTASPAFDAEVEDAAGRNNAGYKIYNSSPADHSIDMADLGGHNFLQAGYLICE